jgi:hypothetical protein
MVFGLSIFKSKYYNNFKKELNYKEMIEYINQLNHSTNNVHDDGTVISVKSVKQSINENGKFILCNIDVEFLPDSEFDNGRVSNVKDFFKTPDKVYPIIVRLFNLKYNKIHLFDGHTRSKVAKELNIEKIIGYVPEQLIDKFECFTKV